MGPHGIVIEWNRKAKTLSASHLRILVMEDDLDTRNPIEIVLSRAGFTVKIARSFDEALALYSAFSLEILISDMPEHDGIELIRKIRSFSKEEAQIPALALTAYTREDEKRKSSRRDLTLTWQKPSRPSVCFMKFKTCWPLLTA
jgi:DNA-binding response OmpR family regulator